MAKYKYYDIGAKLWITIDAANADTLNGLATSKTAVANTIPVYNVSAQLVGNLVGNADTATKLGTSRILSLTGDGTGSASFDGSANASILFNLANSGIIAGTYPKLTVDAKGRATAGAALVAADIPLLDWSKITTGKPTTIGGFGITDAAPINNPTFTGTVTLPGDPTLALQAGTKQYIDAEVAKAKTYAP